MPAVVSTSGEVALLVVDVPVAVDSQYQVLPVPLVALVMVTPGLEHCGELLVGAVGVAGNVPVTDMLLPLTLVPAMVLPDEVTPALVAAMLAVIA